MENAKSAEKRDLHLRCADLKPNFYGTEPFDAEKDYGGEYANAYFRTDAGWYQYPYTDYPEREYKKELFHRELQGIFEKDGWEYSPSRSNGACPTVKRGKESLYLHPQMFSGVVLKNHIADIARMLCGHSTFRYLSTDVYETVYDMDDADYQEYLERHRIPVRKRLVKAAATRRRTVYKPRGDLCMKVAESVCLRRIGRENEKNGYKTAAYRFVESVCSELIAAGWLVTSGGREGTLVRAVNKTERKAKKMLEEDLQAEGLLTGAGTDAGAGADADVDGTDVPCAAL